MTKRGRPEKRFLSDPDRYAVAFSDMLRFAGINERQTMLLTAGLRFGHQVEPPEIEDLSKKARKIVEGGGRVISFETGRMTSVSGKASTLLHKAKISTSDHEMNWRAAISTAFWLAFFRQDLPFGQLRDMIQISCATAGEPALAEALLRVMTTGQKLPPGIYSTLSEARSVINREPTLLLSTEAKLAPSRS